MSLLIIGGTGTLGRQIVLQALTKGYQVRCLVRNFRKANFLKDWGVELVYGDLTKPETIPPCLKGITCIIDASTSRADDLDSLKTVDWKGKLYLIEAAKVANIKRFIFFSIQNVEQFTNIPLMKLKYCIEEKLKKSKIPYTIFRLTGFYQGLIEQYAIPILENLPVWVTNENLYISYMDTQDIAKFCLRSLQLPKTENQIFFLSGLKGWVSFDIIKLCEELAGQSANVQKIPSFLLRFACDFFGFFEWGQNISDRLAFVEILNIENNFPNSTFELYKIFKDRSAFVDILNIENNFPTSTFKLYKIFKDRLPFVEILNIENNFPNSTFELYKIFKIDSSEIIQLDDYFLEYFIRLLKRLRDINFEDIQKQKNLIL